MNMATVFNKKLQKACEYCKYGRLSDFSDDVYCMKKGVTNKKDYCRHYEYDVLKRTPQRIKPADNYKPEDFKI